MVTAKLQGGLGNQMFQIATAFAYAKTYGFDYAFNFNSCHTPNQGNDSNKYIDTLFADINKSNESYNFIKYTEGQFSFKEIPKYENVLLEGYFQSEKYFNNYKEELFKLFNPYKIEFVRIKHEVVSFLYNFIVDKGINYNDLVAVHVRRGDYLKKSDFHINLTDTNYYKEAMQNFDNKYFIFVSDDIKWCKDNFKGDNILYSPFTDELKDLLLITYCGNQIIANSSFSWWGAYLKKNELPESKVIAPKQWFGPNGPKDTQDIIPENCIKI